VQDIVFIVAVKEEIEKSTSILDHPVIFSGVGKINATIAACKAINLGYKKIINIGSCGSFKYSMGTLLKIGRVYQDIDITPLCNYGETLFEDNSLYIDLNSSEFSCITTDYFIDKSQINKYSPNLIEMIHSCSVFDMECCAIAKVCNLHDINFVSYKWVSDDGDSDSWMESCKIGFEKLKKILEHELKEERI
jgi:adenosylhomocysteine nucleosidase